MRGTMLWFNVEKDLGYITTEDGEKVAVHGSGFVTGAGPAGRCAGNPVEFRVAGADGERVAHGVELVSDVAPRRARMRHRR